jgi:hypothetical protein
LAPTIYINPCGSDCRLVFKQVTLLLSSQQKSFIMPDYANRLT